MEQPLCLMKKVKKIETYKSFARVYDLFMAETPYEEWVCYIEEIFKKEKFSPELIAELGCGTGTITTQLAKKGYSLIGIDISEEMLLEAREKAEENKLDILYLNQDMTEFELYGTVDCVISLCDSVNYILEEDDLLKVFKLANNYLNPNGLFIFDINTIYKFENILGSNSFSEVTEDASYIWENYYDKEEMINEFYTNFFIKDEKSTLYERFEEYHYEKAYTIDSIKELLLKVNFEICGVYDAFSFNEPQENSERIYFVAKEISKNKEINNE